jgi:hypothetical protein
MPNFRNVSSRRHARQTERPLLFSERRKLLVRVWPEPVLERRNDLNSSRLIPENL